MNKQEGFSGVAMIGIISAIVFVFIIFVYFVFPKNEIDLTDTGIDVQYVAQLEGIEANSEIKFDSIEGDASGQERKDKIDAKFNVEVGEKAVGDDLEVTTGGTTDILNKTEEVKKVTNEGTVVVKVKDVPVKAGSYETYGADKVAMASTGDVVIFFHASWCPSCRGLNSDIEKNLSLIPDGVTILKVDYDAETELKKKYGVTTQHTLVQVDKDGNLIKKWSGGSKLENLLSQLQ